MKMYLAPYRHIRTTSANRYHGMAYSDIHVPLNVKAEEDAFIIDLIVPGLRAEDLEIEIVEDTVDIKGEFPKAKEDEAAEYLRQEFPLGSFHRRIKLPTLLDVDAVEAHLEEGVLSLRVPKVEEAKLRTINVKVK